jgi:hypothetical protein
LADYQVAVSIFEELTRILAELGRPSDPRFVFGLHFLTLRQNVSAPDYGTDPAQQTESAICAPSGSIRMSFGGAE